VTLVSGGCERFLSIVDARGIAATDHAGLTAAAGEVDLYDIGPPLSDEEVARIVAEDRQREERMTLS